MFKLRDKDLINGRSYLDRLSYILYTMFAPWIIAFSLSYIFYNNKITGIVPDKIPTEWGSAVAIILFFFCVLIYTKFIKNIKELRGKDLSQKLEMYHEFNKSFFIQLNALGAISTLLFAVLNTTPVLAFNCFLVVGLSLERPAEERMFRHLRLKRESMKGFKDRPLLEN